MDGQLRGIRQSQTNPKYLHTNSTSHKWPFSAVAELVDNAYDPDVCASKLDINYESFNNQPCLTFTDDGNGLDADGMHKMLSFGFSNKVDTPKHLAVGQYGNGFKSGSMRLGRDAIVFSKKRNTKVIGFLSQTFLENIRAETVLVPIVSWTTKDNRIIPTDDAEPSLKAILKHSIFKTKEELFAQFKKISGSSKGTRIIIYNLKRDTSNRLEFDFLREEKDVILAEEYASTQPTAYANIDSDIPEHTYSLRAYCSILFMKPKLRIHLRGKKVSTVFVEKSLSRTERDTYKPKNIKLVPDKPVKITFGFNPKRNQYGILMYHKNRLIKPYVKVGYQTKPDQRGVGILGVVECNFLQPTHNKQDFLDTNVYRSLIQALGNKLNDYWNEKMGIVDMQGTPIVKQEESSPDDNWVQCDRCQKWRKLPQGSNMAAVKRIKEWFCEMNPDPFYSHCEKPEEPEDPDESRPSYDKTRAKRTAQMIEYQKRAAEDAQRRQQRAKINEQKQQIKQEKARIEKAMAAQQEHKKQQEMQALLQKIAIQQEQIRTQEQQIQHAINKAGPSTGNPSTYEDDDDIQIVDEDAPTVPPIPLKITKVNQSQPSKRPHTSPSSADPKSAKKSRMTTPQRSAAPSTQSTPPTPSTPTVAPLKISLRPIVMKNKTVHKRIQVDENQEEALESEDETAQGKKLKVVGGKKKLKQSGTQVNEGDLSDCSQCWVCRRAKIKMEIKQEMNDGMGGVKVKQEAVVKQEPGEPHHPGDSLHDVLSEAQGSPAPSTSKSHDSAYLQKKVEILTNERNNLRKEVDKLKEQSKPPGDVSYTELQDQLEDSWQKTDDLQKKLDAVDAERNLLKQELDLSRIQNTNEALAQSAAQLRAITEDRNKVQSARQDVEKQLRGMTEERNLLVTEKQDLNNRVRNFTKTLSERLSAQEKEFNDEVKSLRNENSNLEAQLKQTKLDLKDEMANSNAARLKAQERSKIELEECKSKVKAVLDEKCKQFQDQENSLKTQLAESHHAKGQLLQKFQDYQEQFAQVDELKTKQKELTEEMERAKEKERKVVKMLEDVKMEHGNQLKQVEEEGRKRVEECRKQFQVQKAEYEDKQQDVTKKLAAAQQEISDAQNKWEDATKKVEEQNQQIKTLREQQAAGGATQEVLQNLRANIFDLLRNLISQEIDLDTYVTDPRSVQVDNIVQQVLDDNQ